MVFQSIDTVLSFLVHLFEVNLNMICWTPIANWKWTTWHHGSSEHNCWTNDINWQHKHELITQNIQNMYTKQLNEGIIIDYYYFLVRISCIEWETRVNEIRKWEEQFYIWCFMYNVQWTPNTNDYSFCLFSNVSVVRCNRQMAKSKFNFPSSNKWINNNNEIHCLQFTKCEYCIYIWMNREVKSATILDTLDLNASFVLNNNISYAVMRYALCMQIH